MLMNGINYVPLSVVWISNKTNLVTVGLGSKHIIHRGHMCGQVLEVFPEIVLLYRKKIANEFKRAIMNSEFLLFTQPGFGIWLTNSDSNCHITAYMSETTKFLFLPDIN